MAKQNSDNREEVSTMMMTAADGHYSEIS